MRDAWSAVSEHPSVRVAVDLIAIGICVVRTAPGERERYRLLVTPALDLPATADTEG